MKKVIKAICCILAAVILVGGGYVAGQRAKQSSIVSALPKNILDMPNESNEPSESAEPESKPSDKDGKLTVGRGMYKTYTTSWAGWAHYWGATDQNGIKIGRASCRERV